MKENNSNKEKWNEENGENEIMWRNDDNNI